MHALASKRLSRITILLISALVLAGCGKGDGPQSIAGAPATPLPPIPPDFCDAINFEVVCELPGIENFNGGATTVIDNPDMSGINDSAKVAQMQKFADEVFGGTKLNLAEEIDFASGEFYKVKVWSPRPVAVSFKLEETGNPGGGLTKDVNHTGSSSWEELCFDFTGQTVPPPVVALTIIFDLGELGQAASDPDNWTFFYDEIQQASSCASDGGGAVPIDPDSTLFSTTGDPDLVIPDDYSEVTAFGSESVINDMYADDTTYSPVLAVSSGTGYGANVAQIGFTGFLAGFAGAYETVDFKIKGMPNQVVFVKLFDDVDALRINLTSSASSGALGDGWFQVSIPIASFTGVDQATGIVFESDNTASMQFTMLLTDIGFSGTGTGGPVEPPPNPSIIPDAVIYATDPGVPVDLAPPATENFGSGAVFDGTFAGDADYNPAFQVTSGEGYGAGAHVGFVAFNGYAAGFASGYETVVFKAKVNAPGSAAAFEVKFINGGDTSVVYDLTSYSGSTDLGNGWYQVSIPMTDFAATIAANSGFLLGPLGGQTGAFTMLLTDIGFSGTAGGGGDGSFVNGDFETGDFTGWTTGEFGIYTVENDTLGGRTSNFGRLQTTGAPQDVFLSQIALGAGTIVSGDMIDVSFDLYGTLTGDSGVVFVEVIFLNAAGQDEGGRNFVGPAAPYFPTTTWTTNSGTVTAGTGANGTQYDVSGGVTLQLKAACGGVPGCVVDAYFDNVTFTVNGGGG